MNFNEYEKESGKVSYANFMNWYNIDLVLCNEISGMCLELQNAEDVVEDDIHDFLEVYQFYLVNSRDVETLKRLKEPIYYVEELDLYVLGITHFGTSWTHVLTDIDLIETKDGFYYPSPE